MLNHSTKIVVIGAGAVGSFFGGLLTKAGYPVLLMAKEPVASALNSQGLTIKWANADEHIAIQASANYADTAQAKLVLVCVKTPDTENLALQIKPFLAPDAVVLSLQNGIDNCERLQKNLKQSCYPAMIYAAIGKSSLTTVTHFGGGNLTIGTTQTNPQDPVQTEGHLQSIQQLFEKAAIPTTISENMIVDLWTKFVINCVFNGISAIGQINYSSMSKLPEIASLMEALLSECLLVAHACDVPLQADKIRTAIAHISLNWPLQKSSTAQDLAKKKKTEIDHLNGLILQKAASHKIATPYNQSIYTLVKMLEAQLHG